jgi:hypothetical protein
MKSRLPRIVSGCLAAGVCSLLALPLVSGLDGGIVSRLMGFDRNGDGNLTKNEVNDTRLLPIFERYDANMDATLTREEIIAGAEADSPGSTATEASQPLPPAILSGEGRTLPARPTGIGGAGTPMSVPNATSVSAQFPDGMARVGQVVPDDIKEALELSDKQKKQIEDLEKDIASRLDRILNAKQSLLLKERINQKSKGANPNLDSTNETSEKTSPSESDK